MVCHTSKQTNAILKMFQCPSGVWSRDVGVVSSNVRHHFVSSIANDYAVAPLDENSMLVAQISSNNSVVIELPSNIAVNLARSTSLLQRFTGSPSRVCSEANCSHMCRFIRDSRNKYECTCPLGYAISSESPSTCVLNVPCSAWQFACDDGKACVHYAKKCDRIPDCGDGSDESPSLCRNVSPDRWLCNDGFSTIDRLFLCNGKVDCEDGSDERHCRTSEATGTTLCFNGFTELLSWAISSCGCTCLSPASEFDCSSFPLKYDGECVKRRLICDGFPDCENGADESPEMCASYHDLSEQFSSSPEWLYMFLLGLIMLFCTTIVLFCCFRNYSICGNGRLEASTIHQLHSDGIAEANILLPPHLHSGTHVEVLTAVLVKTKFHIISLIGDLRSADHYEFEKNVRNIHTPKIVGLGYMM
ncbi:hypothetical protein Y032_0868g2783 [Ancylostoma ceylanicum]|uniref:Low-density lipoprotein receptor domain class A n=2 Tax=Ancylostoma ceylanicum TaxID=53326 RepID=A0A016WAL6_9BILA|nr:hypothetical protein Y032_0868g2783 [Ancylostoma ceylanicum]